MKRIVMSFSIFLITLLGFFLSAELACRFESHAWPFEKTIDTSSLVKNEKGLLWKFPLELRNKNNYQQPKELNEYKILFLGDSLFFTSDTPSGKFFHEVVENKLNQMGFPQKFTTLNAGMPGYTTYQEFLYLKLIGIQFKPDLVVLGFVNNDVYYPYLHLPSEGGKTLGAFCPTTRLGQVSPQSFLGCFFSKSYFANFLAPRFKSLTQKIFHQPFYSFDYRSDFFLAWKSYGWSHAEDLIGEMNKYLKDQNIKFMVIAYPVSEQTNQKVLGQNKDYVLYPQMRIRKICDKYQIPFLDLTPTISENGGPSLYRDYLHLNPKGNQITAEKIGEYLKAQVKS